MSYRLVRVENNNLVSIWIHYAMVAWLSWLKRLPSKQEITSSNLVVT